MQFDIQIRQRRQATIPDELLNYFGVGVGDSLHLTVENDKVVITPKKQVALNALEQIQRAFSESGVKESTMQQELNNQRNE